MAPGAPTIMGKLPVINGNFLLFLAKTRVACFNYRSACAITGGSLRARSIARSATSWMSEAWHGSLPPGFIFKLNHNCSDNRYLTGTRSLPPIWLC